MPTVLVDVGTCGIEHDVAADVSLHRLGHEDTARLFLVVPILVAEIPKNLPAKVVLGAHFSPPFLLPRPTQAALKCPHHRDRVARD